ncbi:MAG: hypothetical protein KatS3mg011_1262 [Acidimicrobiia bacterium]|nr:MAG: hypothetical protein KatS3mg011_1262 [Acidimicrobiia bacterium]
MASPSKVAVIGPNLTDTFPEYTPSPLSSNSSAPGRHWETAGTSWKKAQTVSGGLATVNSWVIFTRLLLF